MDFYRNFLRFCSHKGVYPSAVAEAIGLKRSAVNRWKNGSIPSDVTLQKLADYFEITPDSLLIDEYEHLVIQNDPMALDAREALLLKEFRELSADGQEKALIYIQDLISSGNYRKKEEADTSSA